MMAFLHSDKKNQNGDTKFSVRELCQRDKIKLQQDESIDKKKYLFLRL